MANSLDNHKSRMDFEASSSLLGLGSHDRSVVPPPKEWLPAVATPDAMWEIARARVEEIGLQIMTSSAAPTAGAARMGASGLRRTRSKSECLSTSSATTLRSCRRQHLGGVTAQRSGEAQPALSKSRYCRCTNANWWRPCPKWCCWSRSARQFPRRREPTRRFCRRHPMRSKSKCCRRHPRWSHRWSA